MYNVLIQLLPLKSLVFVVHFLNAFWHGNEAFPKGSSQNETVALLVVFLLPCNKYKGVKICFYQCCYQNQNLSFVQHSCRLYSTPRVALVSLVCHSCPQCRTRFARVALASFVPGTRVVNETRSFDDCFDRTTVDLNWPFNHWSF